MANSAIQVLSTRSVSDNTAQVGDIIDLSGYEGARFTICVGTIADADASFTVLMEESTDNFSSSNEVKDKDLFGTEEDASFRYDNDNNIFVIGYHGEKQYIRMTITPSNNTSEAIFSVNVLLMDDIGSDLLVA